MDDLVSKCGSIAIISVGLMVAAGCDGSSGKKMKLHPPSGLAAHGGTSSVTLTWTAEPGVPSYNIYWATSPGVTKQTGTRIEGVTSPFVHSGLVNGTTYHYVLTLRSAGRESGESDEAFARPVDVPSNLAATPGFGEITLTWDPVTSADSYDLYWSDSPGVMPGSGNLLPSVSSPCVHPGLSTTTRYYYILVARNGVGGGAESDPTPEVWAIPAGGAIGELDPTFNGQGWVVHHNAGGGFEDDQAKAVVVDSAGRILVVGISHLWMMDDDMVVWCYDSQGSLDLNFNRQGWVTHHLATGGGGSNEGWAIALDASERILVAGLRNGAMALWRINADGTLDPSLNGQGWVVHDGAAGGTGDDSGRAVLPDASGRILVTGFSAGPSGTDMVVWRYTSGGTLDTSFDGQGWVVAGGTDACGRSLALDAAGRILVAGRRSGDMALWRYNPDGTPDVSFDGQGWTVHDGAAGGSGDDRGHAVTVDASGRILVAGSSTGGTSDLDMVIWRYDPAGSLDASFGGQGWVVHHDAGGGNGADEGMAIVLDTYGRVLVGGYTDGGGTVDDMVIWRYNPDGSLDPTFNNQGWVVQNNPTGGVDYGWGIALDDLGRILVAGCSWGVSNGMDMVTWRFR